MDNQNNGSDMNQPTQPPVGTPVTPAMPGMDQPQPTPSAPMSEPPMGAPATPHTPTTGEEQKTGM